jgi:hypothetical protein
MNSINIDLIEIGWDGMVWIDLAQDRDQWRALMNTVMNLRVPRNTGKFLSSCTIGSFSRSRIFTGNTIRNSTDIPPTDLSSKNIQEDNIT